MEKILIKPLEKKIRQTIFSITSHNVEIAQETLMFLLNSASTLYPNRSCKNEKDFVITNKLAQEN